MDDHRQRQFVLAAAVHSACSEYIIEPSPMRQTIRRPG